MKVLLAVWITVCLIQEVIPSTLVRLPRHLSKQPSLVRTEYEAKYEQTGKHGNESSSVVSGKQEIVHNNCAENWNEFAEKCASLIKDLVASLAGAVSSKPGDATNLQLQIKNTFKHFDSTHNCTCLNHTGKKLSDLDLSPLFNNISISTVRPNTNDCSPPCTEADNTEGKALEVDPTKVSKLQKEKNRALIDAEHLDVNSENADGLKDESTNNYRRQAQVPQALEKKPQKIEKLGDPFGEGSTHSTSYLKDKPALAVSTKLAERVDNGPIDSQISKPATDFPEGRDYEPRSSRLPTALTSTSGALKSIPDNSVRNNQTPDILLGKYSPPKSEYEKPIQEPLKSVQPTTPKGRDLGETLDQLSTKPILSAKAPKHTKTSEKKPFLVFPVVNSNSNLPESSPPENHVETVTSSSIVEPIFTDPSLSLSPKAMTTHKNPTVLSQHESALPELEYGQRSTLQEATTCTPITNNDPETEDDLHHTMSLVNPVTKILEGANQQSEDVTLGKDPVQETAPSTTNSKLVVPNAQIPEAPATISEINAPIINSVTTTCSPIIETSATSESTSGLTGIVYTTADPNTAYSPIISKTSAAQSVIASTANAQSTVPSVTISEIPAGQTIFDSTTCAPIKETPSTSESTGGPTGVVYTTITPNTAHSSTIAETTAASGTVSSATTSETFATPGAASSAIASSATTSETFATPGAVSSAIASTATTSEASAAPGAASSAIASSATTSETFATPGAASSAIASSATTPEASAAPGAASSAIASSATTSEASAAPGAASSAIASSATTSETFATPGAASSAIASSATTSEACATPGAASSAIASSATTSEASAAPGAASSAIASSATTSEASAAPGAASSAIASTATTSEAFATPGAASSAIASSATTSEASAAPGAASSAIASSATTSEASAAPGAASATASSAIASSATTDSTFSTKSASLVPEYMGTTLQKQTKTPENTQYSSTKVTTPVFIYPLKSSTVVPTVDSQINPQSVVTEDSNGEDPVLTKVHSSSSTPVDWPKNTGTTQSFVYPLYLHTDAVDRETPRTSFTESPSETTAEIKPAGPGLLVPKNENQSPQEEGQVPVLTQPTTFQTTSEDPTPSQTLTPQQTESTKFLIPTTLAPRDFDGTIPVKHTSPKFREDHEDDDDDEDCCSCESCTDEEITDPKQFKENACRDLEEARRELKAIFDKIKKKLKCGRKTPQSITTS